MNRNYTVNDKQTTKHPNKKLLFSVTKKDLVIQTFQSGGPGGQHQNKTASGVRITHPDSGAKGESRSERSQYQNKKIAFRHLATSKIFRNWIRIKAAEISSVESIEEIVERLLIPKNLKIEIRQENNWVEEG